MKITCCIRISLIGILCLCCIGIDQTVKAAVKEVDRRNASEKNSYFVVFCSRGRSPTGHAFVTQGIDDSSAQQCKANAFGFYPLNGKGVLGPVPGRIAEEALSTPTTDRLIVRVNKAQYDNVAKIRKRWETQQYRVIERDCVAFISEVAKDLGLKLPDRDAALLPQEFVRKMLEING